MLNMGVGRMTVLYQSLKNGEELPACLENPHSRFLYLDSNTDPCNRRETYKDLRLMAISL